MEIGAVGTRTPLQRLIKIAAIVSFLLILVAIVQTMGVPPATTYDISIYDALPAGFWICILAALFISHFAILIAVISKEEGGSWASGFLAIIVANCVLLSVPLIRGYFIYGAQDEASHIGWVKDVLITGNIGQTDYYPLMHIHGAIINLLSNIPLSLMIIITPVLFSLFFILAFHLLSREVFVHKGEVLLATMFSSIMIFQWIQYSYAPYSQSFLLIPFGIYLLLKGNRSNNKLSFNVLLILVIILLAFFHPLTSLVMIGILALVDICPQLIRRSSRFIARRTEWMSTRVFILMAAVVFSLWSAYTYALVNNVTKIFLFVMGESLSTDFQFYSNLVSISSPDLSTLVTLFMDRYGQAIILSIMAFIAIAYILYIRKKNSGRELNIHVLVAMVGFIFFIVAGTMFFVLPITFIFMRIVNVALIFSLLLVPFVLYRFLSNPKRIFSKVVTLLVCLCIISLLYFSTFNLLPSPKIKEVGNQVELSSYVGMSAYFHHCDRNVPVWEIGPYQVRYLALMYGMNVKEQYPTNLVERYDHFGYDNNQSISIPYSQSFYLYIDDSGRAFYPSIYPQFSSEWKLTPTDFSRLKTVDPGANLVYNDGNFENYYIYGRSMV